MWAFFTPFLFVWLSSLRLIIEKKKEKLQENHTCDLTQAFSIQTSHTNVIIFSPITSTQCHFYQALSFYLLFAPSQST